MKDKRKYLLLTFVLELIFIIMMLIYYVFFAKNIKISGAEIIFLLISFYLNILLYKESKMSIEDIKKDKKKLILIGIWMLFYPFFTGVLCLYFVSQLNKKEVILPTIKDENKDTKTYIKSIILIIVLLFTSLIYPRLNIAKHVSEYIIYAVITILVIAFNYKELISNFIIFKNNLKKYVPFILKRYLLMIALMAAASVPIILFNNAKVSSNQDIINNMFTKIPILMLVLSTLYAPFVEENIFRLSLSKLFNNKTVFIIVSGVLFGIMHMITKMTSAVDILYIFQYSVLGMSLAKAYKDTNNIYVPMSMHFIQNLLAAIIILIMY